MPEAENQRLTLSEILLPDDLESQCCSDGPDQPEEQQPSSPNNRALLPGVLLETRHRVEAVKKLLPFLLIISARHP